MSFRFIETRLPGLIIVEPQVFPDDRGFFMETYKRSDFARAGIDDIFVQTNQSKSTRGTLRGLHYQRHPRAQAKLMRVLCGEIHDVVVDLRHGGPTYGEWLGFALSAINRHMLYIPAGFAHGFCVLSEQAEVLYMTTAEYSPDCESGVLWNDPCLAIEWPVREPTLSSRDRAWPTFHETEHHFSYSEMARNRAHGAEGSE